MEPETTNPFGRLQCFCTFTDSAKRLAKKMDALPDKPPYEELKAILKDLRAEHAQHVTQHNQQYARAFIEYHRIDERPILKTTAFSAGDVKRARDPPPKKSGKGKGRAKGVPSAAQAAEGTKRRKKKAAKTTVGGSVGDE